MLADLTTDPATIAGALDNHHMPENFLNNLPGMAYRRTASEDGRYEFLSAGARKLTGYEVEQLQDSVGYPTQLIFAEDRQRIQQEHTDALAARRTFELTYRLITATDELKWVCEQGSGVYADDGTLVAIEGYICDITESITARIDERTADLRAVNEELEHIMLMRMSIEQELRQSEAQYRTLFETMMQGVIYQDDNGKVIAANPAAQRILNRTEEQMQVEGILAPDIRLLNEEGDEADSITTIAQNTLATGIPAVDNVVGIQHEDGEITNWVMIDVIPLFKPGSDTPYRVYSTFTDITELKLIQSQLSLARDEALAAEKAMSGFLANMSHELRTPIHGILSFARFGIKKIDKADKEKLLQYFDEIQDSGQRLLTLVNDLLDLSKLRAGRMAYEFNTHDLTALTEKVVDELRMLAKEKSVTINCHSTPHAIPATMDHFRISQVVRNLLSNALKFSPEHGEIHITLHITEDHDVMLSICDQGPGIPNDELKSIFEDFTQSSTTRTNAGGTGLGLPISKAIIEEGHRGEISAYNHHAGGACFSIRFPQHSLA